MGCGCLIVLASAVSPRLGLFLMWLFTDKVPQSFDGNWIVAVLGFFFLPWTTLAWAVVWAPFGGVTGVGWFLVIFAFLVDVSTHLGAAQSRREQRSAA